ncbi:ADP-ribosylglycohydrolase family protein [Tychonema sp. BBK16]|uniref:ADP-ribosylglycohydrolase family protein n=1 Tax=Tychonema sp. BBK16 TaxID=2699888 RepID=UPI001F286123|nr:ADP-ribosylglycohydrolase family protein [Tychonema sp. BBK16]MCF6373785.1 ADP-ribosylglycohydrolase family protein [Tychonema sp. BBK16]
MRHSLSSKFQATLLGSALGNFIGIQYQNQLLGMLPQTPDLQPILQLTKHQLLALTGANLGWKSFNGKLQTGKNSSEYGRLAVACAQSLIRCGGLDLKDWRDTWEAFAQSEFDHSPITETKIILHPCEAAVAALPIALFFHENKAKLREKLLLATEVWQNQSASEYQTGVFAVGYTIARSLKERLDPATIISQTIAYLATDNALTELLSQVQILLEQGADLERATTHLCKSAIALQERQEEAEKKSQTNSIVNPENLIPMAIAFYCFLSTPEDLRLSVLRAARCGIAAPLTCALTGALSGAYNGSAAIPVEWKVRHSATVASRSVTEGREPSVWLTGNNAKIEQLADNLFAVWTGVYSPHSRSEVPVMRSVVAAPYVIRHHQ